MLAQSPVDTPGDRVIKLVQVLLSTMSSADNTDYVPGAALLTAIAASYASHTGQSICHKPPPTTVQLPPSSDIEKNKSVAESKGMVFDDPAPDVLKTTMLKKFLDVDETVGANTSSRWSGAAFVQAQSRSGDVMTGLAAGARVSGQPHDF